MMYLRLRGKKALEWPGDFLEGVLVYNYGKITYISSQIENKMITQHFSDTTVDELREYIERLKNAGFVENVSENTEGYIYYNGDKGGNSISISFEGNHVRMFYEGDLSEE